MFFMLELVVSTSPNHMMITWLTTHMNILNVLNCPCMPLLPELVFQQKLAFRALGYTTMGNWINEEWSPGMTGIFGIHGMSYAQEKTIPAERRLVGLLFLPFLSLCSTVYSCQILNGGKIPFVHFWNDFWVARSHYTRLLNKIRSS